MVHKNIRKHDSLGSEASRLRSDMKIIHGKYSDQVAELAMLTKSELKIVFKKLDTEQLQNGTLEKIGKLINDLENVLYEMDDTHSEMNEIVQVIGGLEFATGNIVDKFYEILLEQEKEQGRMNTEINHLRTYIEDKEFDSNESVSELKDTMSDFQLSFSRFQDYVIDSVPRLSKLFDELDREEEVGLKYGKTKQI